MWKLFFTCGQWSKYFILILGYTASASSVPWNFQEEFWSDWKRVKILWSSDHRSWKGYLFFHQPPFLKDFIKLFSVSQCAIDSILLWSYALWGEGGSILRTCKFFTENQYNKINLFKKKKLVLSNYLAIF